MDERQRRLLYRATRRGMKEADALLGGFAKARLNALSQQQLDRFEELLNTPDSDIMDWLMDKAPLPPAYDTDIFSMLRAFRPEMP